MDNLVLAVAGKKSLGSCDIDLITASVQPGIPAIQNGDFAFISVNNTDILSALLQTEHENEGEDD
jgi:hypothetical protein